MDFYELASLGIAILALFYTIYINYLTNQKADIVQITNLKNECSTINKRTDNLEANQSNFTLKLASLPIIEVRLSNVEKVTDKISDQYSEIISRLSVIETSAKGNEQKLEDLVKSVDEFKVTVNNIQKEHDMARIR